MAKEGKVVCAKKFGSRYSPINKFLARLGRLSDAQMRSMEAAIVKVLGLPSA
jgi:hypothetical protein